ncbi:MAG: peptidoglycan editing factor PgeF [Patescibacteria group bacterium]|nr:peptidoglycan editing factor PgeF [Patescibacteria group bacterium]
MTRKNIKNSEIFFFDNLLKYNDIADHFIAARKGGFSKAPYHSLNLALHVGDNAALVRKNRRMIHSLLGACSNAYVYMNQTHGSHIMDILKGDAKIISNKKGKSETVFDDTDALVTAQKNIYLLTLIADCVPVLLLDKQRKVIAVVHAGWRGTVNEITKKTVHLMISRYHCDPSNIIAGIGPSIGPCCFEVENDTVEKFKKIYSEDDQVIQRRKNGKNVVDLWKANYLQLKRAGVPRANVEVSQICTACSTDLFYSVRKEKITGRFGVGIMLK